MCHLFIENIHVYRYLIVKYQHMGITVNEDTLIANLNSMVYVRTLVMLPASRSKERGQRAVHMTSFRLSSLFIYAPQ